MVLDVAMSLALSFKIHPEYMWKHIKSNFE